MCLYTHTKTYIDCPHSMILLGFLLNVEQNSSLEQETKCHRLEPRGLPIVMSTIIDKSILWSCAAFIAISIVFLLILHWPVH